MPVYFAFTFFGTRCSLLNPINPSLYKKSCSFSGGGGGEKVTYNFMIATRFCFEVCEHGLSGFTNLNLYLVK